MPGPKLIKYNKEFWQPVTLVNLDGVAYELVEKEDLTSGTQKTQIVGADGYVVIVNEEGQLHTVMRGRLCPDNSRNTILTADEIFTGEWVDILDFANVQVLVNASHDSAIDGLKLQFSSDKLNVDSEDVYSIFANNGSPFSNQGTAKWFRLQYVNGITLLTHLRISTILQKIAGKASSHRIGDIINAENDAELSKAVLTGLVLKTGIFKNVLVSEKGELTVLTRLKEYDYYVNKFGVNGDVDTGSTPETIWDGSVLYTHTIVAQNYWISSSDNTDTNDITIELLVVDGVHLTREYVTVALQGQTSVEIVPTSGLLAWRCNRAFNSNGTENLGNVYIYESTAIVLGVPSDITKVRAIVQIAYQQTEQAVYSVPSKLEDGTLISHAHLTKWDCEIVKKTAVSAELGIYIREQNKVFRNAKLSLISDSQKGGYDWGTQAPKRAEAKSDIEVRVGAVTANDASISGGFQLELIEATA